MIILEKNEKMCIKLCKGHYQKEYPFTGSWVNTLKPLFKELYGWDPDVDHNYPQYCNTIFGRLLEIYLKIQEQPITNRQLIHLFEASFYKTFAREEEHPIERVISALCGEIQCNSVLTENGEERYNLYV